MESKYHRGFDHQYFFYDREMDTQDIIDRDKYWKYLWSLRFVCIDPAIRILLLFYFILWSMFYFRVLIKERLADLSRESCIFIPHSEDKEDAVVIM